MKWALPVLLLLVSVVNAESEFDQPPDAFMAPMTVGRLSYVWDHVTGERKSQLRTYIKDNSSPLGWRIRTMYISGGKENTKRIARVLSATAYRKFLIYYDSKTLEVTNVKLDLRWSKKFKG